MYASEYFPNGYEDLLNKVAAGGKRARDVGAELLGFHAEANPYVVKAVA